MNKSITEAVEYIKKKTDFQPEIGMILGTGLGALVDDLKVHLSIPYSEIPNFPVSTAPSHMGKLLFAEYAEKKILIMQGRVHYYEGYTMKQVTFPVRVMSRLGIENLIITNVSGSLRREMPPGSIIIIEDHINYMGANPLVGANDDSFGERFPSMHDNYSADLRMIAMRAAYEEKISVQTGVYIGVTGPSLETKSECKAFAQWGADIVGMSTVPEVIVAVHSGISVLGVSVVSNMSNLFHDKSHLQEDIRDIAAKSYPDMKKLIEKIIIKL